MKMTLTHLNTQKRDADDVLINVGLSCRDVSHLKAVVARVRQIRGVTDVVRGFS
jgi:(p)ppGpp synthase/HD superfamily hydrolase